MPQTPNTKKQYRDLLGGMLLVPALNIAAFVLLLVAVLILVPQHINTRSALANGTAVVFLFIVGFIQLLYLLPFVMSFSKKGRMEVVKGMLISGAITLLISGNSCYLFASGGTTLIVTVLAVYIIAIIATLVLFLLSQ
jgi:hypothetical protein